MRLLSLSLNVHSVWSATTGPRCQFWKGNMTGDFGGSYSTRRACREGVLGLRIDLLPKAGFRLYSQHHQISISNFPGGGAPGSSPGAWNSLNLIGATY